MKTRSGFVSNSSSSSFIAVATLPAFREALTRMDDERDVKIIKAIAAKDTCMGLPVQIVEEFSDAGGFSSIWGCDGDSDSEILEKAGIEWPPTDEDGDEVEDESWYPHDAVFNYTQVIEKMAKEKDWKDQIFQRDVGDGG